MCQGGRTCSWCGRRSQQAGRAGRTTAGHSNAAAAARHAWQSSAPDTWSNTFVIFLIATFSPAGGAGQGREDCVDARSLKCGSRGGEQVSSNKLRDAKLLLLARHG